MSTGKPSGWIRFETGRVRLIIGEPTVHEREDGTWFCIEYTSFDHGRSVTTALRPVDYGVFA